MRTIGGRLRCNAILWPFHFHENFAKMLALICIQYTVYLNKFSCSQSFMDMITGIRSAAVIVMVMMMICFWLYLWLAQHHGEGFVPCIVYSNTVRGVKNLGDRLCFAWKAGCNKISLQTQTPLGYYSYTQCRCRVIGLRWDPDCFLWSLSSFGAAHVCVHTVCNKYTKIWRKIITSSEVRGLTGAQIRQTHLLFYRKIARFGDTNLIFHLNVKQIWFYCLRRDMLAQWVVFTDPGSPIWSWAQITA